MQGVVVGQMAVIAGGAKTDRIFTAVGIFPRRRRRWGLVGMAAGAKLVVPGGVKGSIKYRPAGDSANTQTRQNKCNTKQFHV